MRDGHHRARVVLEERLEPRHRLRIEMVGRLVEQQQVGRLQQEPAQRHPPLLAAAQRRDVGIGRRQAQGVHRQLDAAVEIPGVGRVDLVLHPSLLLEHLVHLVGRKVFAELRVDLVEPLQQPPQVGGALFHVAAHVLRGVERGLLRQVAHRAALCEERFAAELGLDARHDAQQRALAGPVVSEDADLGPRQKREPDVLEDDVVGGIDLRQPLHRVDVLRCHVGSTWGNA